MATRPKAAARPAERMLAPENGVRVRMYRQGHGDCFLLAFPGDGGGGRPVYMMIDCGNKRGSEIARNGVKITADMAVADIAAATGGHLDVVAVTHEHEDHVNQLGKFAGFTIDQAWFAWTEDPEDADANEYRRRHHDQLVGLIGARNRLNGLSAAGAAESVSRLDELLQLEIGGGEIDTVGNFGFGAAAGQSVNKKAMKAIKDRATKGLKFISPHTEILKLDGVSGVRIFPLGPPRSEALLKDEDPKGDQAFPGHGIAGGPSLSFFAAAADGEATGAPPFAIEHGISEATACGDLEYGAFFTAHYGQGDTVEDVDEVNSAAAWRRIDNEWLFSAESLALKLNTGVNNTSLVLAFELPQSHKVLLFAADAQSGNWRSWTARSFKDGDDEITVRDLLSRTVLYKVGHHGSHNATLAGKPDSPWPNLEWMGEGAFAGEFTAMITAHREWAINKAKWDHPLAAIRHALEKKTQGRLFQIDMEDLKKPDGVPDAQWALFTDPARTKITDLYVEYTIEDRI